MCFNVNDTCINKFKGLHTKKGKKAEPESM